MIAPVVPTRRANAAPAATGAGRAGASGFSLPAMPSAASASTPAIGGVSSAPAVSALLALQGVEEELSQKRARQLARGGRLLDALERLQRAVLLGADAGGALASLRDPGLDLAPTGDPGLDQVLAEIEVRRAVELAKLEMTQRYAAAERR